MHAQVNTLTTNMSNGGTAHDGNDTVSCHGRLVELEFPSGVDVQIPDGSILKPSGSGRKGYNLMDNMGLSRHHKQFYNQIKVWLVVCSLPAQFLLTCYFGVAHHFS